MLGFLQFRLIPGMIFIQEQGEISANQSFHSDQFPQFGLFCFILLNS